MPAWCINKPKILFDLHSGKKSETSPIIMKSNFQELKSYYMDYKHIYTDGSKLCEFQMGPQFLQQKQKLLI